MSILPRVSPTTRERVSREFDDLGPTICVSTIETDVQANNPEWLDIARQWIDDLDDPDHARVALCMFYRLLTAELPVVHEAPGLSPLPRVTDAARNAVLERIDTADGDSFSANAIEEMERSNPELLRMADDFASGRVDYALIMRGFALLYATLKVQADIDRLTAH